MHKGRIPMQIFFWAAFGVFSQLAFVRIFSTTAGETTYYGNAFFIIALFALSCGFFARKLAAFAYLLPAGILVSYFTALWLGSYNLLQILPDEFQWWTIATVNPKEADFDLQLAVFLLCTAIVPVMVLIGSKQGECFVQAARPARGYLLMAAGGIGGALVFTAQNQFLPSQLALLLLWSAGLAVGLAPELRRGRNRMRTLVAVAPLVVLLGFGGVFSQAHFWSPYQRVDLRLNRPDASLTLHSNGFFISTLQLQSAEQVHRRSDWEMRTAPFRAVQPGDRVLVLGSGGGTTDVREALYRRAGQVTAVEIDRLFVDLGLRHDPDRAYARPEVTTHIADARRFLNTTRERYDLVFLPFLDSQTNASNQARFRLDSFLYTREGLALAYSKLADDGLLFVSFATGTAWIRQRMFNLLQEATGAEVRVFGLPGTAQATYVISRGRVLQPFSAPYVDLTTTFTAGARELVPDDDWPFFYSRVRGIPREHLRLLFVLGLGMVTVFCICRSFAPPVASGAGAPALSWYALFSGAAFFFIQIRTISALTPWFGATYLSQAMVVSGIIFASLMGALIAVRFPAGPRSAAWIALFAFVALGFFATTLFHPLSGRWPAVLPFLAVLLLPVFLAGYLYVRYLDGLSAEPVLQMQLWNLVGGAVGGLAEGIVILTGFDRSLWLVAVFYGLAFLAAQLHRRRAVSSLAAPVPVLARAA